MTDISALPVAVDLADAELAADVIAHVESHLGWQVIRPGPHLPVWLRIADRTDHETPTVVVAWHPTADLTRHALQAGALDVLAWPADADRLRTLRPSPQPAGRPADRVIGVAAAAPGVGTSTVVLALGALLAWDGHRTVVVTDAPGRRLVGIEDPGLVEVAGVEGLAVASDRRCVSAADRVQVLLADLGVARRGQVLVGRPDHHLAAALAARDPLAVVTVGVGGLRPEQLRRMVGWRCHVTADVCFRTARAGFDGRVPVGLPGRYLARLHPVVTALWGVPARGEEAAA
jgi:hypothetical protein